MDPIEYITKRLIDYPELSYEAAPGSVSVRPPNSNGFEVSFLVAGDGYQVGFDGWHAHFSDVSEALDWFVFGLTNECRLKVVFRGNMPCQWTVQSQCDGEWEDDNTTGLLFVPFWRKRRAEYFQNNVRLKNKARHG